MHWAHREYGPVRYRFQVSLRTLSDLTTNSGLPLQRRVTAPDDVIESETDRAFGMLVAEDDFSGLGSAPYSRFDSGIGEGGAAREATAKSAPL
jgi:hypothetical protein